MTTTPLCRRYTRILRTLDPRLGMALYPDSRDPRSGVLWVTFDLAGNTRLKVITLDALLQVLGQQGAQPGHWIVDALHALRWRERVFEAHRTFLHKERLRALLAAERAQATGGLTRLTVAP